MHKTVEEIAGASTMGALNHLTKVVLESVEYWDSARTVLENAERLKAMVTSDAVTDSELRSSCLTQLDLLLASAVYQEEALRSWSNRALRGFGEVLEAATVESQTETPELNHEGTNNEK